MTNEEQQELAELKLQKKLKPKDRARLKILERKFTKAEQKDNSETDSNSASRSIFAQKPTTTMPPTPIRYSEDERIGLKEMVNNIIEGGHDRDIDALGKTEKGRETKLIRASILLLRDHSHTEIIDAIVVVKRADMERKKATQNVFGLLKKEEKKHYKSVRFSSDERTGLKTLADDIVMNSFDMVVEKLNSTDDINTTKLIRAAAHLLKANNHEDIIDAVEEVKLGMFSIG